MITHETFHRLRLGALDCADLDEFLAEEGGSLPACYYADDGDASAAVRLLTRVWDFRTTDFAAIRKALGLTQRAFSVLYGIPLRTVESWCSHSVAEFRCAPDYVIELLATDAINRLEASDTDDTFPRIKKGS